MNLSIKSDNNHTVNIRHVIIERYSQWLIGHNFTRASDDIYFSGCKILLQQRNGSRDSIAIFDDGIHTNIDISRFQNPTTPFSSSTSSECTTAFNQLDSSIAHS